MYVDDKKLYCKSKTGKVLELLFGTLLIIITFPLVIVWAIGIYVGKFLDKVAVVDDNVSKTLSKFFG